MKRKSGCPHRWAILRRGFILLPLFLLPVILLASQPVNASTRFQMEQTIAGPFTGKTVEPYIFTGSLLNIAGTDGAVPFQPQPLRYTPGQTPKGASTTILNWNDPVAQTVPIPGLMPDPILTFAGMQRNINGSGWPPDTNGDVGGNYYIQTVNTSIAIYNKTTGTLLSSWTFDAFFSPAVGSPCQSGHRGDPVVVYDRFAQRWVISDFKLPNGGPYYECVAVSQTTDPINGGWYYYSIPISDTAINDYPKLGVWRDTYVFTFNMFSNHGNFWGGVQVWALEKASMIAGEPTTAIYYTLSANSGYNSLLPSHALSLPPEGASNYLVAVEYPDSLLIWKFTPDWYTPENSTFTGPTQLTVAPFATAASISQPGSTVLLDSLSYRPMMQLIYRAVNGVESLWLTHTVASGGVAGLRWYEVRQPAGAPVLHQQGTYQPDSYHRWMGSLSVDQDGNMALGYSIGSGTMYPGIRYTGRLAGEIPGLLPQGEKTIVNGTTSQAAYQRWGDYSAMAVDPADDCTFYYTTEYYLGTSPNTNWQTRVGSFKYPSCGQPEGRIRGMVRDSISLLPIPGVQVVADSPTQKMTVISDNSGVYTITLSAGTFSLTAGPLLPGYPEATAVSNVSLAAGDTTAQDIFLGPASNLNSNGQTVDDNVPTANNNGYAEPGESDIKLWLAIENTGALASTGVTAQLATLTPGVTIITDTVSYPDIAVGQSEIGLKPFGFSIEQSVACGSDIQFRATVTDTLHTYLIEFSVNASIPLPRANLINHNVENGSAGWITGGSPNTWAITSSTAHSPTHSWTDSPSSDYADNATTYLKSPVLNTWYTRNLRLSFWTRYSLETGWDYVFLDYSTNGGATWSSSSQALATLTGIHTNWEQVAMDIPDLQNNSNLAFRFRLVTDTSVAEDGIYLDDISLSYQPYACIYGLDHFIYIPLVSR
jgi:Carboxypeptidase regulatory-like domain